MKFQAEVIVRGRKYLLRSGMSRKCQSASFGTGARFTRGNSPPTVGVVNYASKHTRTYVCINKPWPLIQVGSEQQWTRGMKRRNAKMKKKDRWGARTLTSNQGSRLLNLSQQVPSDKTQHAAQRPPFTEYLTSHQPLSSIAFNDSFSVSFFFPFLFHSISVFLACPPPAPSVSRLSLFLSMRMDGLLAIH